MESNCTYPSNRCFVHVKEYYVAGPRDESETLGGSLMGAGAATQTGLVHSP